MKKKLKMPRSYTLKIFDTGLRLAEKKEKLKKKQKGMEKDFDAVNSMREIRDRISLEIADMNFEELKAYFKES